jgi:hypothetical protein
MPARDQTQKGAIPANLSARLSAHDDLRRDVDRFRDEARVCDALACPAMRRQLPA